jgi:hypothetical protein
MGKAAMNTRVGCAVTGLALLSCAGLARGQAFTEHFDAVSTLVASGWFMQNNSEPLGTSGWFQGNPGVFVAQTGATNAYIAANFNNTGSLGTISNWLLTPAVILHNGDTLKFWSRSKGQFPDRLEVRLSTTGTATNVGVTSADIGDFTTVLLTINPTLVAGGYPAVWTQYTATVADLTGTPTGRFAFRYFVTNGGSSGANSDYIGIDEVVYAVTTVSAGACCALDGTCAAPITAADCTAAGGTYQGDGSTCTPGLCGGGGACYANCDSSTTVPFLNVQDFACFLNKFSTGDPYGNCDGSTTPPTLNVSDFGCFLLKFSNGCSAP